MSKPGASRMCPDCTSMRADSVCHMLFECTSLSNVHEVGLLGLCRRMYSSWFDDRNDVYDDRD